MTIGIDARFYGTLGKGLGRYTAQLIHHLEKTDTENRYVIFLRPENYAEYVPKNENFRKVQVDIPWYSLKEQLVYPFILRKYNLDLMHFPHFNVPVLYRRPFVLTLHDLILFHYPTLRATTLLPVLYGIKYAAYRWVLKSAVRQANHIITVSEFTKQDILKHFSIPASKITVTYQAASNLVAQGEKGRGKRERGVHGTLKNPSAFNYKPSTVRGIMSPYFLYVGNAYPHKNLEMLARAFSTLGREDLQLVLVGKEDHFYAGLKDLISQKRMKKIIFTGEVNDEELDVLYRGARAYVFPSLYEGFGLPPLEAMAHGVPVAASHAASLSEVLGNAALYFDPRDSASIQNALRKIADDEHARELMVRQGYERIKQFSWVRLAEETLRVYTKHE